MSLLRPATTTSLRASIVPPTVTEGQPQPTGTTTGGSVEVHAAPPGPVPPNNSDQNQHQDHQTFDDNAGALPPLDAQTATLLAGGFESWSLQRRTLWPRDGQHILAQYDDHSIVVYQAFNATIAKHAVERQSFLGCDAYSTKRMTWVKTNFLWMMYRSGWAQKDPNQARILALRLTLSGFHTLLARSANTFGPTRLLAAADVRLQWDPDHDPSGGKVPRRAIQLGIKGATLQEFLTTSIVAIADITDAVVAPQRHLLADQADWPKLMLPRETVYVPPLDLAKHIGVDSDVTMPQQHQRPAAGDDDDDDAA